MADTKKLEQRKRIKSRKPKYDRINSHKANEISRTGWRKPKGKHDKTRKQHKSKPRLVQPGFGSPSEVKGLLRDGLMPLLIRNMQDLARLDPKTEGAVISSSLGMKKRLDMIKKAKELNITLVNIKNADEYVDAYLESRKALAAAKTKQKEHRKKKAMERTKKKEKEETIDKKVEKTEEEKKKEEKQIKDDILTKKQKD